jgi:hypothetical protein
MPSTLRTASMSAVYSQDALNKSVYHADCILRRLPPPTDAARDENRLVPHPACRAFAAGHGIARSDIAGANGDSAPVPADVVASAMQFPQAFIRGMMSRSHIKTPESIILDILQQLLNRRHDATFVDPSRVAQQPGDRTDCPSSCCELTPVHYEDTARSVWASILSAHAENKDHAAFVGALVRSVCVRTCIIEALTVPTWTPDRAQLVADLFRSARRRSKCIRKLLRDHPLYVRRFFLLLRYALIAERTITGGGGALLLPHPLPFELPESESLAQSVAAVENQAVAQQLAAEQAEPAGAAIGASASGEGVAHEGGE